jgi:translation initiation factor IF-3
VRLVGPAGEQVGVVRIEDALRLAAESDLDLVEVAPQAKPPVCKLMDFGKYKYEAAVKAREARKNQTNTVLKEIRFRLKIDTHDYETKRGHALRFLGAGDKVKAMIQFRGREQQRPEMGIRLLQRFADDVAEVGVVESSPRIDGRNMVMVVGPLKNKAEAKAEARRASQRAEAKAENEAKAAEPSIASQTEVVDKLKHGLDQMKGKLNELTSKRNQLVARSKTAAAQSQVHDALKSIDFMDPTSEVGRFEEKIRREEAKVRGQQELAASSLDAQFNSLEDLGEQTEIEARLAALKSGGAAAAIGAGEGQKSGSTVDEADFDKL